MDAVDEDCQSIITKRDHRKQTKTRQFLYILFSTSLALTFTRRPFLARLSSPLFLTWNIIVIIRVPVLLVLLIIIIVIVQSRL